MKKLGNSPLKLLLAICVGTATQLSAQTSSWSSSTSADVMTDEKSSYTHSVITAPIRKMSAPYADVEAVLGVSCDGVKEQVYLAFSKAPNLANDETKDGYNLITTRIKWDNSEPVVTNLTQDWGSTFLYFSAHNGDAFQNIFVSREIARNISLSNRMLLELNWYGQGQVYFDFPLNGASAELSKIRAECASYPAAAVERERLAAAAERTARVEEREAERAAERIAELEAEEAAAATRAEELAAKERERAEMDALGLTVTERLLLLKSRNEPNNQD